LTSRLPSGDHSKVFTPFLRFVTRRASPPSSESSQTCARGVGSPAPVVVCKALGTPGVVAVTFAAGVTEAVGALVCGTGALGRAGETGVGVGVPCCVAVL